MNNNEILTTKIENSSTINQIDYDPLMEKMIIQFKNNSVYEFYGVPKEVYDEFISASSIGKHFHQHIKSKFDFAKRGEVQNDNR